MNNSKFKPEYERWAYQIFDESVECLKDGLHLLSRDLDGKKFVVNTKKKEHVVFCIVRYLELCDENVHNYLSGSNMSLFGEEDLKTNVRELFAKFIEDPTTVQGEQGHFLNFLQWVTPLAVDTD